MKKNTVFRKILASFFLLKKGFAPCQLFQPGSRIYFEPSLKGDQKGLRDLEPNKIHGNTLLGFEGLDTSKILYEISKYVREEFLGTFALQLLHSAVV